MKPSEFLAQLEGHGIYDVVMLYDLDEQYRDCVPVFTQKQTQQVMDNRGLGGTLTMDTSVKLIYGYTTADALARKLAGKTSTKMGRGSSFRDNVEIVREAGF
jgi:hypothetical protein